MGVKRAFADFTPILDMPILGVKRAFADFTPVPVPISFRRPSVNLPVTDGSNSSLAPLRKRMGGEIVVLVAVVVRDFKSDPVR